MPPKRPNRPADQEAATKDTATSTGNRNIGAARKAKNDEFYTQYHDIGKEMNAYLDYDQDVFRDKTVLLPCDDPEWSNFSRYFAQNFERLGLKKLISTSYAIDRKPDMGLAPQKEEVAHLKYDAQKARSHGRVFTLTRDTTGDGRTDFQDLEWEYLEGDGDFRSAEVTRLRDEADIIITNPPFSLFREFLSWIVAANKKLVIIGNMNAITYKEVFPLIKDNKMWLGATANGTDLIFAVPPGAEIAPGDREKAARMGYIGDFTRLGNACWFTSLDHGRRHEPLALMTEADNIKFSKHKEVKGVGYQKYDNYDAIEVPFTDAIPSDHQGVMGVPISFLSKYNPEQFEILGGRRWSKGEVLASVYRGSKTIDTDMRTLIGGKETYDRIFIRHKEAK